MSNTERGEAGSKSTGYVKQLQTFSIFFTLHLFVTVFCKSESLAHSLQSSKLSLTEAYKMVMEVSSAWNSDRNENKFNDMWALIVNKSINMDIDEPVLPRPLRIPRRLDGGAEPHHDQACKDLYRRIYFNTLDAAICCLKDRFQSKAFNLARDIESAVI